SHYYHTHDPLRASWATDLGVHGGERPGWYPTSAGPVAPLRSPHRPGGNRVAGRCRPRRASTSSPCPSGSSPPSRRLAWRARTSHPGRQWSSRVCLADEGSERSPPDALPDPLLAPALEPPPHGCWCAVLAWKIVPPAAGSQHIQDALASASVVGAR